MSAGGYSTPACDSAASCAHCRVPVDSRCFDVSGFSDLPDIGGSARLARFELPPQYCGVLEYFAQFTDAFARDPARVETPGLSWLVLVNGRPLDPYLDVQAIVNPWGAGSFPVWLRLEQAAIVELAVRRVSTSVSAGGGSGGSGDAGDETNPLTRVGARLVGRYWYDPSYGDVVRRRS